MKVSESNILPAIKSVKVPVACFSVKPAIEKHRKVGLVH